jgi:hypothetical protein
MRQAQNRQKRSWIQNARVQDSMANCLYECR